jgi:hypothetical protein
VIKLAAIVVLLLAPAVVRADDKMRAVALFDEGIKEMKAGNFEKACPLFRESNRLVPDSGTRGSLARCYTQLGRVASAWLLWRELADTAPTPDLRSDAAANAAKLDPRLPRYVIVLASGQPTEISVRIDGEEVAATLDVPTPIDPGTYDIEVSAPGYMPWRSKFTAVEGKTTRVDVPGARPAKVDTGLHVDPEPSRGDGGSRRGLGIAITGGGAIALVASGVFGYLARQGYAEAEEMCGGSVERCYPPRVPDAQKEVDSARGIANMSTVLFLVGGAVTATGVYLIVTGSRAERARMSIAPSVWGDGGGLAISGGF